MEQIDKNTVKAENQLKESEFVTFETPNNSGKRIMFLGNSITLHGVCEDIGWHGHWGMAASAKEKDYVHLLISEIKKYCPDAAFCIAQGAEWERKYKTGESVFPLYEEARKFGADIIIMRLIENCPRDEFDHALFEKQLLNFINYLAGGKGIKVILTTGFWKHIGDNDIRSLGKHVGFPVVELNDLGELDVMKAIGQFTHEGVANHPGDLGMQNIADRIFAVLKNEF